MQHGEKQGDKGNCKVIEGKLLGEVKCYLRDSRVIGEMAKPCKRSKQKPYRFCIINNKREHFSIGLAVTNILVCSGIVNTMMLVTKMLGSLLLGIYS